MKDFKRSIVRLSSTGILLLERAFNYPPQQFGFDLEAYASGSCTCNVSILDQEDESTGTVTPPEEILPLSRRQNWTVAHSCMLSLGIELLPILVASSSIL